MRPIPAPRIGDAHGLLRAIEQRGRLRTDEFVTEFTLEQLFAPELENALGRMRHFISYARSAGLVKEDRGVVELTEVGRRYVRAGDDSAPFDVSPQQAEWLRRQLREKHMTDSIFHGMAIGLSLLASVAPGGRVSTLDFGRSLAYLGRAGWDNENTFRIQGERYFMLLADVELIEGEHRLTATGEQVRSELTLPVHMSLLDIAAQLNPGGAEAVRAEAEAEWAAAPPVAESPVEENRADQDAGPGAWSPAAPATSNGEGQLPGPSTDQPGPPVPPDDIWETAAPGDATQAIPSVRPPIVPRATDPATPQPAGPAEMIPGDPLDTPTGEAETPPAAPPATPSVEGYETVVGSAVPTPAAAPPADSAPAPGDAAASAGSPSIDAPDTGPVTHPAGAPAAGAAFPSPRVGDPRAGGDASPPVRSPDDLAASAAAPSSPPDAAGGSVEVPPTGAAPPEVPASPALSSPEAAGGRAETPPAVVSTSAPGEAELRGDSGAFVDPAAIRAAAESAGLRFPVGVYANVAAALAAGKHVLLTGAPGAGKTSLALAIARAAAQVGRAHGATLVTARHRWDDQELLVDAAKRGRWVIVDEIDRARLDRSLGELSSFLSGLPVLLPTGEEAEPDAGWRIVATASRPPRASAALLRRFAVVDVPPPAGQVLVEALNAAAGADVTAASAVARLLPLAEIAPLGVGVFLDAARHASARNAAAPVDEATLTREAYGAYIAPLLGDLDGDAARRVREIVGDG